MTSPGAGGSLWHFEGWQGDKCRKIEVHVMLPFNALERGCRRRNWSCGLFPLPAAGRVACWPLGDRDRSRGLSL